MPVMSISPLPLALRAEVVIPVTPVNPLLKSVTPANPPDAWFASAILSSGFIARICALRPAASSTFMSLPARYFVIWSVI